MPKKYDYVPLFPVECVVVVFTEASNMKLNLNGGNTRELSKAVHSLARIGNELYVEGTAAGLILRTVNDSHTAYAVMKFHTGFFTRYQLDSSEADKYANTCKVSMKSCLGVFKNTRQVERCQISLNLNTSKLLFQFACMFGTLKTHNVSILEQESLNAVYMTDNPPNRITAPNKLFKELISNFQMYENEITIEVAPDEVILKNHIDTMHKNKKNLMQTKLILNSQEFSKYHISDPTSITFRLKELRAILNFAAALSLDVNINFESAGKPVVFAFRRLDTFTADFVMSTLPPDEIIHLDDNGEDIDSPATKTTTTVAPQSNVWPTHTTATRVKEHTRETSSRHRSRSPLQEPDTNMMADDADMDVIPQSPQPTKFKYIPRLYRQTQYLSESGVVGSGMDTDDNVSINDHQLTEATSIVVNSTSYTTSPQLMRGATTTDDESIPLSPQQPLKWRRRRRH